MHVYVLSMSVDLTLLPLYVCGRAAAHSQLTPPHTPLTPSDE